jgi:hypothetical protein
MQRLTLAGRLIITLLVVGALYFGFRYLQDKGVIGKSAPETTQTENVESPSMPNAPSEGSESSSSADTEATATASGGGGAFSFSPPPPVEGKLKGVVELGASGFNSFIVKIDKQKNWSLEKAEFGNSLVIENMATDDDIRAGLKKYIGGMLDFGVSGRDIHFVISSGAIKAEGTQKIIKALKSLNYYVNTVTPEQEGTLGLKTVLPDEYADKAFVVDIGSGNTKIAWKTGNKTTTIESFGSKYFQNGTSDEDVAREIKAKVAQIPASHRQTCFIIGGVPFELAKQSRNAKERYTVLKEGNSYKAENAKTKAGVNIYNAIAKETGCQQFVFDWNANFTIGFLLDLP